MAGYNRTRYVEQLLEQTASSPPSFTVHLHPEYWVLNNGSKFLYHNPIASLLDDIRFHRIPVDFLELFDSAKVPFYDGCMVVELLDYRPQKSKEPALKTPDKTRVVLHPNPETLWADICSMNQRNGKKWTDADALEVETQLLLATAPPLCLAPDPHLTRIVNHVIRVSTPSMPASLKRKASAMEPEEDGPDKARRDRIIGFMAPRDNRLHAPRYSLLDTISTFRQKKIDGSPMNTVPVPGNQYMSTLTQPPQPAQPVPQQTSTIPSAPTPASISAHSPTDTADKKPIPAIKAKSETPVSFNMAFQRTNGSHTPVPPQPMHQFVNQHPPPSLPANTAVMQPQVYANVHAATEAAKRAPTPAQMHPSQQYQYQQYQLQQQQQPPASQQAPPPLQQAAQPPQAQQPLQARPPSQPQLPPQQHPQPVQQQTIQHLHAQTQQRYTQSPKPTPQASSVHAQVAPQAYSGAPSTFPQPNNQYLMAVRNGQKSQMPNGVPQQHQQQHLQQQSPRQQPQTGGQPSLPQNANVAPNPNQQVQAQMLYNQQLQQTQQQLREQSILQQQQQQQRLAMAQVQKGGRMTPQVALPVQNQQAMGHVQQAQVAQVQNAATTPSPVRGSPMVNHQQLAAASAVRASPMPAKSQLPPQQPQLGAQGMQIHQQHRVPFPPPFNPSALRPVVHNSPQAHMALMNSSQAASPAHSSPKNHATPSPAAARPITPAINAIGDVKQQMQQPLRRPTPLQQQQMMHSQHMQQQNGTPHLQPQIPQRSPMPPHSSPRQQAQQSPAQQHQQAQQPQQPQMQAQGQTPQTQMQQQMALYPQTYGFPYQMPPQYWRGVMGTTGAAPQAQNVQAQAQAQAQMQQQIAANHAMLVAGQGQQQQQPQQQVQAQPQQQQQAGQQGQLSMAQKHAILMSGGQQPMMMPKVEMQHQQQQQGGQAQKPLGRIPKAPPVGVGSPFQLQGYMPNPTTTQAPVQGGQGKGKVGAKKGPKKAPGQR